MLLLYILWDDWPISMISGSNEQIQQQLEYTLQKPDCHSWWISKMQSGRENTLEERYAKNFCFKLGKMMPQKRMEWFRLLFEHLAWIEHHFLSCIRDSKKAVSLWKMTRGVGGVRKSIHQSWLAKGLGLGLGSLCWGLEFSSVGSMLALPGPRIHQQTFDDFFFALIWSTCTGLPMDRQLTRNNMLRF